MDNFFQNAGSILSTAQGLKNETNREKLDDYTNEINIEESKKRQREGIEVPIGMELLQMGLSSGKLKDAAHSFIKSNFSIAASKELSSRVPQFEHIINTADAYSRGGLRGVMEHSSKKVLPRSVIHEAWGNPKEAEGFISKLKSLFGSKKEAIESLSGDLERGAKRHYENATDGFSINSDTSSKSSGFLSYFNSRRPFSDLESSVFQHSSNPLLESSTFRSGSKKALPGGDTILDTGNVTRALNFDAPVDEPEVGESPLDFIKRKASELKERYTTKPLLEQKDDIANSYPAGGDNVLDRLPVSRLNFEAPAPDAEPRENPLDFLKRKSTELKQRYLNSRTLKAQIDDGSSLNRSGNSRLPDFENFHEDDMNAHFRRGIDQYAKPKYEAAVQEAQTRPDAVAAQLAQAEQDAVYESQFEAMAQASRASDFKYKPPPIEEFE
tara:strand:+ start:1664 stop:2983 length:1320 start_codon:yes stop_codon:yes gene_type:complete